MQTEYMFSLPPAGLLVPLRTKVKPVVDGSKLKALRKQPVGLKKGKASNGGKRVSIV